MIRIRALPFILIIALLLSACSQEIDLTLQTDQKWEFETEISLNLGLLPEFDFNIVKWFGIGVDTGEVMKVALEIGFDQMINYYQMQGLEASWKKPLSVFSEDDTYRIAIEGQGWDQLARLTEFDPALFGQAQGMAAPIHLSTISVTDIGNDQMHFLYELPEDPWGLRNLSPMTYRLHGSKIIDCNGCSISGGTATWVSPYGAIEAVLIPASPMPQFVTIGLITSGAGGGGAIMVWVIKLLSSRRQPTYRPRTTSRRGTSGTKYQSRRTRRYHRRR